MTGDDFEARAVERMTIPAAHFHRSSIGGGTDPEKGTEHVEAGAAGPDGEAAPEGACDSKDGDTATPTWKSRTCLSVNPS